MITGMNISITVSHDDAPNDTVNYRLNAADATRLTDGFYTATDHQRPKDEAGQPTTTNLAWMLDWLREHLSGMSVRGLKKTAPQIADPAPRGGS